MNKLKKEKLKLFLISFVCTLIIGLYIVRDKITETYHLYKEYKRMKIESKETDEIFVEFNNLLYSMLFPDFGRGLLRFKKNTGFFPKHTTDISKNLFKDVQLKEMYSEQPTFYHYYKNSPSAIKSITNLRDQYFYDYSIPFCYFSDPESKYCILWSIGPDNIYQITNNNITSAFDCNSSMTCPLIREGYIYDPTNGLFSSGDVFVLVTNNDIFSSLKNYRPEDALK